MKSMNKRDKTSTSIIPEERYRNLFDNAGEGFFQASVSGRIMNINPALARTFGYSSPEEMKRNIKNVDRQLYADRNLREIVLRRVEAQGHAQYEFRFIKKDKSLGWGYASLHAVRNAQGKTVCYEGFCLDITARKKMEKQLRESHDLLEQRVIDRTRKISQLNSDLASDIAKRKKVEKELRLREKELKRRTVKLEELNITLRTILDQRDIDRKDLERRALSNIDNLIMPDIELLKNIVSTKEARALILSLEDNLHTLTSSLPYKLKKDAHLTFKELQIANFIRKGKTSKEIGTLMKLSMATVNVHRNSIRKKLGIIRKKVNLQTYLLEQS